VKNAVFKVAMTAGSIALLVIPVVGVIVYEIMREKKNVTSI